MKAFVIDVAKCNGCYNCQIACKDEHVGNDWSPYAKPQPDTGQFWMKINEKVGGSIPKVKVNYIPALCMHCDNAVCLSVCPEKAIYKRDDGLVIIDPEKCNGCRICLDACVYRVLYFNRDLNIAQKCTGCAHLIDKGWKEPRCVEACPTGALRFGEENELIDLIKNVGVLSQKSQSRPRVYYLNLSQKFVAGAAYDPEEDECIEGAIATLTDLNTGEVFSTKTDNYGDFWLRNLKVSLYSLVITKEGYRSKKMNSIRTDTDVNVGDIGLSKRKGKKIN